MLHLDPERCNLEGASHEACPECGRVGALRPYGGYGRPVVDVGDGDAEADDSRVRIARVICRACGTTHSLIPTTLTPRSPFTARLRSEAVRRCRLGGESVASVAESLHASATTVRSMLAEAPAVSDADPREHRDGDAGPHPQHQVVADADRDPP